tara:strand:- start:4415 stop:4837 length:423 start_codon:yes stop_codon:yes gene_type:complete
MRSLRCLILLFLSGLTFSQSENSVAPILTVKEIMNTMITPTTATIWGAYELENDSEWQEVKNAAIAVIGAGNLLFIGGSAQGEALLAREVEWQEFNRQMIEAAQEVIAAVDRKDEEALFTIGNDKLYPPCESCHQRYQPR